ncbi:hypothetical protein AB0M50_56080, partial [Nonomuraea fuscirosea]
VVPIAAAGAKSSKIIPTCTYKVYEGGSHGLAQHVWDTIGRAQLGIHEWVSAREKCERRARAAIGDQEYRNAFLTGYGTGLEAGIFSALDPGPLDPSSSPPSGPAQEH